MWSGACGRAGAAWRQAVIAVRLSVSGFCTHEMVLGINVEWRLRPGRGCVETGSVCYSSERAWLCTHEMVLGIDVEWRLRPGRGCVEAGRVCCLSERVWVLHA